METGFVITSYVATFVGIGVLVVAMFRRARSLAQRLPPEDRPWT
jgi:CcmD family protein